MIAFKRKNKQRARIVLAGIAAALCHQSALAQIPCNGYEVAHVIKAPPAGGNPSPTWATAISPDGHYVTGTYRPGSIGGDRVFLFDAWTGELFLIPLGAGFQEANGNDVNNEGVICGTGNHVDAGQRAFAYDSKSQTWTGLPADGAFGWSGANGINSANTVCGFRSLNDRGDPVTPLSPFEWDSATGFVDFESLVGPGSQATDITNGGVVCGWTGNGAGQIGSKGFVLSGDKVTILPNIPGGFSSNLMAINESGIGCGYGRMSNQPPSTWHALLWDKVAVSDLGTLPGYSESYALDLNNSGVIVGASTNSESGPNAKGTIWFNGDVIDVNELFEPEELEQVRDVQSISAGGILVGRGVVATGVAGYVLVPKPGLPGDINSSCSVDVDDLLKVINEWGNQESIADLDRDGVVGASDLMIVLKNWTFE